MRRLRRSFKAPRHAHGVPPEALAGRRRARFARASRPGLMCVSAVCGRAGRHEALTADAGVALPRQPAVLGAGGLCRAVWPVLAGHRGCARSYRRVAVGSSRRRWRGRLRVRGLSKAWSLASIDNSLIVPAASCRQLAPAAGTGSWHRQLARGRFAPRPPMPAAEAPQPGLRATPRPLSRTWSRRSSGRSGSCPARPLPWCGTCRRAWPWPGRHWWPRCRSGCCGPRTRRVSPRSA